MFTMHCMLPFVVVVVVMASTRPATVEAFAASPSAAPAVRPSVVSPAVTPSSLLLSSTKNEGNSPREYRYLTTTEDGDNTNSLDTRTTTTPIFPLPTLNGHHLELDRLFPRVETKTEEARSTLIDDLQVQHVQWLQLHHQHPELFAAATPPPPHTRPTTAGGATTKTSATSTGATATTASRTTTTAALTTTSSSSRRPSTTRLYVSSRRTTDDDNGKQKLDYLATITLRLFRQKIAFVLRVFPEPKRKIIIDRFVNFLIEHIL